jgi:hypothetical protein
MMENIKNENDRLDNQPIEQGGQTIEALVERIKQIARIDQKKDVVVIAQDELDKIDVRRIMIDVVPGEDGMGQEVYAKSTEDVVDLLSEMGLQLEDYVLGINRTPSHDHVLGQLTVLIKMVQEFKTRAEWIKFQSNPQVYASFIADFNERATKLLGAIPKLQVPMPSKEDIQAFTFPRDGTPVYTEEQMRGAIHAFASRVGITIIE